MANISIAFILAKPDRTGAYPIRCRITISRKQAAFNTPFKVLDPADFDTVKQSFRKNKAANVQLDLMRAELQLLYIKQAHERPTAKDIKHRYQNSFDSKSTVLALLDNFIAHKEANTDIKQSSVKVVARKLNHLRNFITQKKLSQTRANTFSVSDIESFETYLQGVRKRNGEPLRKRNDIHQAVSSMFRFGEEKGYIESNPYKSFKMPKPKPTRRKDYLTISEVQTLLNADTSTLSDTQKYYLLLFIFAVSMGGLSFIDLREMKEEHIKKRGERLWIVKHREKVRNSTGAILETPLSELALKLYTQLLEYRTEKQKNTGRLFTAVTETYINAIKSTVKNFGIDKHITPHCSRNTFASAMDMLEVKDSLIQDSLGHKLNSTLHTHYLQIQDEVKIRAMDKLSEAILNYKPE